MTTSEQAQSPAELFRLQDSRLQQLSNYEGAVRLQPFRLLAKKKGTTVHLPASFCLLWPVKFHYLWCVSNILYHLVDILKLINIFNTSCINCSLSLYTLVFCLPTLGRCSLLLLFLTTLAEAVRCPMLVRCSSSWLLDAYDTSQTIHLYGRSLLLLAVSAFIIGTLTVGHDSV